MRHDASIYATTHPVTRSELIRHLAASKPVVDRYVHRIACRILPGDRIDAVDLWRRTWGIRVPLAMVSVMLEPLLSVEDVAETVGVSSHTIRRAGNDLDPRWNLPEHADLGPRVRRYLPLHIRAWINRVPPEPWLERQRGPIGPLGLALRAVDRAAGRPA